VVGGAVSWLHTPEDPQHKQQQQQQHQGQLDLIGMPTVGVAARGAAMSKHLGVRLAQLSQAQEEVGRLVCQHYFGICPSKRCWVKAMRACQQQAATFAGCVLHEGVE
jgi:hypothetical protein